MFYIMFYLTLTATIEFIILLNEDEIILEEIFRNIYLTFLMMAGLYKGFRLKMQIVKDMVKNIIKRERQIFDSGDKDIIKILKDNILLSNLVNKIYSTVVPMGKYFYLIY